MKSQLFNVYGLVGTVSVCLLLASGANAAMPAKIDICHAPPENPANTQLIQNKGASGNSVTYRSAQKDALS